MAAPSSNSHSNGRSTSNNHGSGNSDGCANHEESSMQMVLMNNGGSGVVCKLERVAGWLGAGIYAAFFASLDRCSCVRLDTLDFPDQESGHSQPFFVRQAQFPEAAARRSRRRRIRSSSDPARRPLPEASSGEAGTMAEGSGGLGGNVRQQATASA